MESILSNESSDVGSSNKLSSAVCKADVILTEISWTILRRISDSDGARSLTATVDTVVDSAFKGNRDGRSLSVEMGDNECTAGANGGGTGAVCSAISTGSSIFNVL